MIIDMQGDDERMDMIDDMIEEYLIDHIGEVLDEEDLLDHLEDGMIESIIREQEEGFDYYD